jgi:hypothetical protein
MDGGLEVQTAWGPFFLDGNGDGFGLESLEEKIQLSFEKASAFMEEPGLGSPSPVAPPCGQKVNFHLSPGDHGRAGDR